MDRADRRFDTSRPWQSFLEVARGVLVEPAAFFSGLGGPRPGQVKGPLVFAIICGLVTFPLSLILEPYNPLTRGQPGLGTGFSSIYESNRAPPSASRSCSSPCYPCSSCWASTSGL